MIDYRQQVQAAMQNLREGLKPVVEKEVLHYGILDFMQQKKYLQLVVFMGGTSLRLCHGSKRYSEDLDFSAGKDFNPEQFRDMAMGLEKHIEQTYGLPVRVKPPKSAPFAQSPEEMRNGVCVDKWVVSVETNPGQKDIPRQVVKIELANVPAHDVEFRKTVTNYASVPMGTNILLQVSSKTEILTDKLLSLPAAKYNRYRDVWDIAWLSEQGTLVNHDLLAKKIHDYGLGREQYLDMLRTRLATFGDMVQGEKFYQEMSRFLSSEELHQINNPNYRQYLEVVVKDHLLLVQSKFSKQILSMGAHSGASLAPPTDNPVMPDAVAVDKFLHRPANAGQTSESPQPGNQKLDCKPG